MYTFFLHWGRNRPPFIFISTCKALIRKRLSRRPENVCITELSYRKNLFIIFFTGCREWQGPLAWHSVNQKCLSISRVYERSIHDCICTSMHHTFRNERERETEREVVIAEQGFLGDHVSRLLNSGKGAEMLHSLWDFAAVDLSTSYHVKHIQHYG